ncbi:hypothetical protein [Streptomyces sp. CC208A]|uniref:hypothetical protein n=1 Tax=Streptomyces sp. CC208A TaxID=3044573 RepID=UPI0024A91E72|nr:hypothetical protein [Streptomyces sp. CC208A]
MHGQQHSHAAGRWRPRSRRVVAAFGAQVLGAAALVGLGAEGAAAQPVTCFGAVATVTGTQGTPGDDVIIGTPGNDRIDGGGGDDRICGLGGATMSWTAARATTESRAAGATTG